MRARPRRAMRGAAEPVWGSVDSTGAGGAGAASTATGAGAGGGWYAGAGAGAGGAEAVILSVVVDDVVDVAMEASIVVKPISLRSITSPLMFLARMTILWEPAGRLSRVATLTPALRVCFRFPSTNTSKSGGGNLSRPLS